MKQIQKKQLLFSILVIFIFFTLIEAVVAQSPAEEKRYFPLVIHIAPTPKPTLVPTPTSIPTPIPGEPPPYSTSLYMKTVNPTTFFSLGCEYGGQDQLTPGAQDTVVFFAFGKPTMNDGIYGASLFGFGPASTDEIEEAIIQFGSGYRSCLGDDEYSHLRVAVGTSNYGDPDLVSWWDHGRKWARMVNDINKYFINEGLFTWVDAVGASDMELAWNGPPVTRQWVEGYDYANKYPLYNFGAAEGCPTRLAPQWQCASPWTQEDVWYISFGSGASYPMPLIYATNGVNARQWAWLSVYAVENHGAQMQFKGSFTQYQACQQRGGCDQLDNTPEEGWQQLYDELNYDERTEQLLQWTTDIKWWGE